MWSGVRQDAFSLQIWPIDVCRLGLQVKVFSRNCEDRSTHFPDVADAIRAAAAGGTV